MKKNISLYVAWCVCRVSAICLACTSPRRQRRLTDAARTQPATNASLKKIYAAKIWRERTRKNWRGALNVSRWGCMLIHRPFFRGEWDAIKKPRVRGGAIRKETAGMSLSPFFTYFLVWHSSRSGADVWRIDAVWLRWDYWMLRRLDNYLSSRKLQINHTRLSACSYIHTSTYKNTRFFPEEKGREAKPEILSFHRGLYRNILVTKK